MIFRLSAALWIGFMLSTACMSLVPALGFAAARFTCDGDFSTDAAPRRNLRFYCTDPQTKVKTPINAFKVMAISTVVYSVLLLPLVWVAIGVLQGRGLTIRRRR